MNISAFLNTITNRSFSMPVVILYVTAGCNLKCIMCSYRDPLPNELSLEEIKELAHELSSFGLRHIVFSGGEPLTRKDIPLICKIFEAEGAKQSMLTNGVLLNKRYDEIRHYFSEIIVSLDGASPETHDIVRGLNAFDIILKGIKKVVNSDNRPKISIRTVIQKSNFRNLDDMVELALSLGVDRISFLAVDVLSDAFNREYPQLLSEKSDIMLSKEETYEFKKIIEKFTVKYKKQIDAGFISESQKKLFHIVEYFEALTGKSEFPKNNCNAPMVSAVITSTGEIQPCFFLKSFGNIRSPGSIKQLLNNQQIKNTRQKVRDYSLQQCQQCVCTLKSDPFNALSDNF